MDRRQFLKGIGASPILSAILPGLAKPAPAAKARFRRVRPKDPDWPKPEAWEKLKSQVGGRLIPVASPLAPCVEAPSGPACASRLKELANPYFISEQPGGTQLSGWYRAWTSAPSVYAVAAQSAEDIAAAVNFARQNRLRLVVKGTGHSYLGNSSAPDSLLIWTHAMRGISIQDDFVPQGCPGTAARHAVTIETGARWIEAYEAVTTRGGRYVQGGGCCTVGVAGLVLGGGFGSFSKLFGLAAASLLEAEIVTADGKIRTTNVCTNPDLFWALKGGGGGTFGIATRLTLATHELPETFGGASGRVQAKSDGAFQRLVGEFFRHYQKHLFSPNWGEQVHFGKDNTLSISMVVAGLRTDVADAAWEPFRQFVAASPNDYEVQDPIKVGTTSARNWWDYQWRKARTPRAMVWDPRPDAPAGNVWWTDNSDEVNAFIHGYESVWLPAALLGEPDRLADAIVASSRHFEVELHMNKGLAGAPAERLEAARDTAMNPAVLDAFALAIVATGSPHSNPRVVGHEPDLAKAASDAEAIHAAAEELRVVAPNAGSYGNESNYFDRSFQKSYWGSNYPRLLEAKKKYDPDGLFFVHNGVGSEEWSPDGFERIVPAPSGSKRLAPR